MYNNIIHNLMGMSLFSIVYWKVSHHLLDLAKLSIGKKFSNVASSITEQAIDIKKEVRTGLEKSNARYNATANKRRREKISEEGDMVMVYLRKERISAGSYNKLNLKKYDPFKIVKKINNNAYVVDLRAIWQRRRHSMWQILMTITPPSSYILMIT